MLSFNAKSFSLIALAAFSALLSLPAHAHRSWLLPSSAQLESKDPWVTIDAAVSENLFDFDTIALKLNGLTITGPDGALLQPKNLATGRLRNTFDLELTKSGTYKISVISESISASYQQNGEAKRWRGTVEAFAKAVPADATNLSTTRTHNRVETFVSAGKPNAVVLKPSGIGLELLPLAETHPSELQIGQKASFRFLLDGQPLAGLVLSIVPGGVRYRGVLKEISVTTDARGEFSVNWPEAGMYWIGASYPPRVAPGEGQPTRRVFYSGTFEVLPQ